MKKRAHRLRLNKETLRSLQSSTLARVAGGGTSMECFEATGCDCYSQDPACTLPRTACLATCSC